MTRNAQTARQAHLYRGIFPVLYTKPANDVWAEDVDMRVNFAMDMGKDLHLCHFIIQYSYLKVLQNNLMFLQQQSVKKNKNILQSLNVLDKSSYSK